MNNDDFKSLTQEDINDFIFWFEEIKTKYHFDYLSSNFISETLFNNVNIDKNGKYIYNDLDENHHLKALLDKWNEQIMNEKNNNITMTERINEIRCKYNIQDNIQENTQENKQDNIQENKQENNQENKQENKQESIPENKQENNQENKQENNQENKQENKQESIPENNLMEQFNSMIETNIDDSELVDKFKTMIDKNIDNSEDLNKKISSLKKILRISIKEMKKLIKIEQNKR